jgi:hypothetical protein
VLENLTQTLENVPVLMALLHDALGQTPAPTANTEEMRAHLERIQSELAARLKRERKLYAVLHFPEHEWHCPTCKQAFWGTYWELNNPGTGKGLCLSHLVLHGFLAHGSTYQMEELRNVSGVRIGEARLVLDVAGLSAVLHGSDIVPEALAELATLEALQKEQLAQAGAFQAAGGH